MAKKEDYSQLVVDIGRLLEEGRRKAAFALNCIITKTYWEIGKRIVEQAKKRVPYKEK